MPLLYFSYTPPKFATQLRGPERQQVAAELKSKSTRGRNHMVLEPKPLELGVFVGHKYVTQSGKPNRFHGCVEVSLDRRDRFVAEVASIEGPVQLVEVNETRQSQKTWIVNNHIDKEHYYQLY